VGIATCVKLTLKDTAKLEQNMQNSEQVNG